MASTDDITRLERFMFIRLPLGIAVLLAVLLISAGTVGYWQAWVTCGTLLLISELVGFHFLKTDPDFLVHRLQSREKEASQEQIVRITEIFFLVPLLLTAVDIRYGWSRMPAWVCLFALALFLAAYAFVIWVFKVNRYASRIIEVQQGQRVIDTGPYAFVRHPMYSVQIVLIPAFMASLGSWWGGLASAAIMIPLVLRIREEERFLTRELPGYAEYCRRIRYRLIPYVW